MSQDVHVVLDECRTKAESLVDEIERYKSAAEVNQSAADSLESVSKTLISVIEQIEPFTDVKFKKFQNVLIAGSIVNGGLLIAAVALLTVQVLRAGG